MTITAFPVLDTTGHRVLTSPTANMMTALRLERDAMYDLYRCTRYRVFVGLNGVIPVLRVIL